MRIAGVLEDDIVDSDDGIAVSLWTVGCPHCCKGCHNQELWDRKAGEEIPREDVANKVIELIEKNGVLRQFSVLGGEPLVEYNIEDVFYIINRVREVYQDKIKIYLWTGYDYEYLIDTSKHSQKYNTCISKILKKIDVLIDGLYIEELRDTSLKLRGSSNQRVLLRENNYSE
jgi:anaerobic ribonucleoside-triphosphate reductase activating protein